MATWRENEARRRERFEELDRKARADMLKPKLNPEQRYRAVLATNKELLEKISNLESMLIQAGISKMVADSQDSAQSADTPADIPADTPADIPADTPAE